MIYVFLAEGFEETEAITPIDLLKRCGKQVITAGVGGKTIVSTHGIPVVCDITADDIVLGDELEAVILPGGMPGTLNLEKSEKVQAAIDFCNDNDRFICAICAAPTVLGHKGLLKGRKAVCYRGCESGLTGAEVLFDKTAADGKIITSRGAGTAVDFGLRIIEEMISAEKAAEIADSIMCVK